MINFNDHNWAFPGVKKQKINAKINAKALAFVIGTEVAETIAADEDFCNLLIKSDSFAESSIKDDLVNQIYYVDLIKDSSVLNTIACYEKLQAVLLSEPKIYDLLDPKYKYGKMAGPQWSFINDQFIIPGEYE